MQMRRDARILSVEPYCSRGELKSEVLPRSHMLSSPRRDDSGQTGRPSVINAKRSPLIEICRELDARRVEE